MKKMLFVIGAVSAASLIAGVTTYLIGHWNLYLCSGYVIGEVYCDYYFVSGAQNLLTLGEGLLVLSLVGFVSMILMYKRRIIQ